MFFVLPAFLNINFIKWQLRFCRKKSKSLKLIALISSRSLFLQLISKNGLQYVEQKRTMLCVSPLDDIARLLRFQLS